jgi:hypothetical protein
MHGSSLLATIGIYIGMLLWHIVNSYCNSLLAAGTPRHHPAVAIASLLRLMHAQEEAFAMQEAFTIVIKMQEASPRHAMQWCRSEYEWLWRPA